MSSLPIILAETAHVELLDLWEQYASISEELADRILHRLRRTIARLGEFPEMGRLRPEFKLPGLRSFAVNPHVIFYSISTEPSVIIHHVADGRRNLAALFSNELS